MGRTASSQGLLTWLPYSPWWALMVIGIDVLCTYRVVVLNREDDGSPELSGSALCLLVRRAAGPVRARAFSVKAVLARGLLPHCRVEILWPSRPTVVSAPRFPELISAVTRLLTNSVLELARLDAAQKRD